MVCGGVGCWAAAMLVIAMMATAALNTILTIIVDLPDWICDGEPYRFRLAASSRAQCALACNARLAIALPAHRRAAIDGAPHPQPECRAAHLPCADQSLWPCARRACGAAAACAPRRRVRTGTHLHARGGRARDGGCGRRGRYLRVAPRA